MTWHISLLAHVKFPPHRDYNSPGCCSYDSITKQMKSTEVQTLGELRMRGTANWWAGLAFPCGLPLYSSLRTVWHGLATVVDSMRESVHALRCDFLCLKIHRATGPGRGKPVLISITLERFYENRHFENEALNPLVSLFGLFVARGGGNRLTDRHVHTP